MNYLVGNWQLNIKFTTFRIYEKCKLVGISCRWSLNLPTDMQTNKKLYIIFIIHKR